MRLRIVIIAACVAATVTACGSPTGDPARGEKLHTYCLGCHGTELYVPPRARVNTLSGLQEEVERWNDHMNPKFTNQEVEDIVAWLNANFYKLP